MRRLENCEPRLPLLKTSLPLSTRGLACFFVIATGVVLAESTHLEWCVTLSANALYISTATASVTTAFNSFMTFSTALGAIVFAVFFNSILK